MTPPEPDVPFRCPSPLRRPPTHKPLEWFLLGPGRKKWVTVEEAAALEGISRATLAKDARRGCPQSIRIQGRIFYRRLCLDHPPCWDELEFLQQEARYQRDKAKNRKKRQIEKERRRIEWAERRAARQRHAVREENRRRAQEVLRARWKKSGQPWKAWLAMKREFRAQWKEREALELGRDALRLAGKPLYTPEAEREAYRLGWGEISLRMAGRLMKKEP